ncbi:MAG: chromate transporter [Microscillaceae bacterium]|nr:chromate transporter [Microscillaceae bacterium]
MFYFLKLGTWGFGGPVALVGYMHHDLVETKKWITEEEYKEGLALAQLAPGPLAAQLAIYLGYVHYKIFGATVVGLAFIIPSFVMVVGLGAAYTYFSGIWWLSAVFYGVGASIIGIIAFSAYKLTKKSIAKDFILWGIYLISALVTVITESEEVLLFLGAGLLYWLVKAPPAILKRKVAGSLVIYPLLGFIPFWTVKNPDNLLKIALYFGKAGSFVFGSGLAIVPFLYAGVVKEYAWLNEQQFLDAVAVAMITPGPVVITVGFIGFLVEGFWGATVAALATFLPCYLLTIIPAPYFKKHGKNPAIKAFVDGVTAAAIGAITGAVIVLGKRSLVDIPTVLIAVLTILLLLKFKKLQEPSIILLAAVVGLILKTITFQ